MQVKGIQNQRLHTRYPSKAKVRVATPGRAEEGKLEDISAGGASVSLLTDLGNDLFLEMHIEGLGHVPAHVVRSYDGGMAVKFDVDEDGKKDIDEALKEIYKTVDENKGFRRRV